MLVAEQVTLIFAFIAILISVIVGIINHSSARAARESADAAQKQATSAAEQAGAAWASVKVANKQLELNLDQFVEARENYRRSQLPTLVADIAPAVHDNGVLVLVIENLGPGVATNVQFRSDPPLVSTNDKPGETIASRTAFRTGIPTLSPKQAPGVFLRSWVSLIPK